MRRMIVLALCGIVVSSALAHGQWPPERLQNLKVLPSDIPIRALVDTMAGFTRALGVRCTYCHVGNEAADLANADGIVFPGVANFGYLADELDRREVRAPLCAAIRSGIPYLGICAGLHILFENSAERPGAAGLGIFPGTVERLEARKLPHMGWNQVIPHIKSSSDWAYFAHSFAVPADARGVCATTDHDLPFASIVAEGSIMGVQFHPERSGAYGLRVLSEFVANASVSYAR